MLLGYNMFRIKSMEEDLAQIKNKYQEKINSANDLPGLDEIFLEIFGKNGEITLFSKNFGRVSKEELKKIVPVFNETKVWLEEAITKKRVELKELSYQKLDQEEFDAKEKFQIKKRQGGLHVLTEIENDIARIFRKLGFEQYDAPHIDSDYYNFEVLNIPEQHPARDLWDTLYLDAKQSGPNPGKLLLRTHTSNSQVRIMEDFKPPFRKMIIGRCFRRENLDARHEHTFEQFELVYVDKGLSMANLQYLSEVFLKEVFGAEIKVRLKPKYYPFVEPGAGVDGLCIFCKGKGCQICGGVGWLELAGAGMIHPKVLEAGGIDPKVYSGIAWGFGPSRMAMLKYNVEDVREFNSGLIKEESKL